MIRSSSYLGASASVVIGPGSVCVLEGDLSSGFSISKKYILSLGRQMPRTPRTRSATWGRRGLDRWLLETPGDARETLGDTRETHRRHRSIRDAHDAQKTPNKPLASRDTSRAS